MRKQALFAALLAVCLCAPFLAAASGPSKVRVAAEQANIREKPDIGSAILRQIPEGMILEADSKEGEWFLVRFKREDGVEAVGYVHESLVLVIEPAPKEMPARPKREVKKKPEEIPPVEKETKPRRAAKKSEQEPSEAAARPRPAGDRLVVSVSTGGTYVRGGDINAGARGLAEYFEAVSGLSAQNAAEPAHLGYALGIEAAVALNSSLYVGVGVEYFKAQKESLVRYPAKSEFSLRTRPKLSATPIHLSLRYFPLSHFYVQGKIQYYIAGCGYYYHDEKSKFWEEWQGEAAGEGFGAEAAIGAEWKLSAKTAFFVETGLRMAKARDLEGTNKYLSTEGQNSTERGALYYYQGKASAQESYPLVFIREKKPSEAGVSDVRKANVDYSGALLKFGLRVGF